MGAITLKSPAELALMRQAGRLVAEALRLLEDLAEPGVTTEYLDRAAGDFIRRSGGQSAFRGYRGYPADICASLNEEVVHGIPGPRHLKEGDLLKVDVGVIWRGYYADGAATIAIGNVTREARQLMLATREALEAAIAAIRAGVRVADVSAAVQEVVKKHGFSVVTDYTGHGIGRALHEEPKVPNFVSSRREHSPILLAGATIAVEPMVNAGTGRTEVLANGWTVVTADRRLSAHFEHTVAVEEGGAAVLTLP